MGFTFTELLDKYELDVRARGFSDKQIALMRLAIRQFDAFLKSPIDIRLVAADDYRRFIVDLRSRHARLGSGRESNRLLSGNTVNTYGRNVKTFFAWLYEMEITTNNPLAKIRAPKKIQKVSTIYSEKQLLAVSVAVTGLRDRAIYELFLDSGIRLKELSTIKIGDIDVDNGYVKVMGKGSKERFAYFSPLVAESLRAYIHQFRKDAKKEDFLFITSTGPPLKPRGIQIMLSRLGEKAQLEERLAPHKLRHTFATLSKKNGGDIEYLRIIMGHTDVKTTEGYLNVQNEDIKAAHMVFSPFTNLRALKPSPPNMGQPAGQKQSPKPQNRAQEHEADSSKQIQPGEAGEESRQFPTLYQGKTDDAANRLIPDMRERYDAHLRKLSELGGELVNDIEKGNLEPIQYTRKTDPKTMFSELRLTPVYSAQNHHLWPFLAKHLDNEFTNPKLTAQIEQIAIAAVMARILKKESQEKDLTRTIVEKLITVSERDTFVGKCNICESYFYDDGVQ